VILALLHNSFSAKLLVFRTTYSIEEGGRKEGVEKDTICAVPKVMVIKGKTHPLIYFGIICVR